MAKLLHLSRPSRRVREVVRAWWAMRCQKRRRKGGTPVVVVNAPFIHDGGYSWDEFEPQWANTYVAWTFLQPELPVGTFEVWCQWGTSDELVATVPGSDRVCYLSHVTMGEQTYFYRVRYRDGDVIGPFSNVYQVDVFA